MMKCEYCGEKIGLLAVRYTWLDKANKSAMHDKCYEKYKNEQTQKMEQTKEEKPEKVEQSDEEKQIQKEETKPLEKMVKSKIIGGVLLIFTSYFIISYFYSIIVTHTGNSISNIIFNLIILSISVIVGMELVTIKKKGISNILLQICGIILIVIYMIWLIMIAFRISLW